jgi:hypothetical protein
MEPDFPGKVFGVFEVEVISIQGRSGTQRPRG